MGLFDIFKRPTAPPATGENTRPQTSMDHSNAVGGIDMAALIAALTGQEQVPGPTPATYRKMRGNPTVAIARIAATAPIRAAEFTIEEEEGAPAGAKEFIEEQINPLWSEYVRDALFALDYGWKPWEKIYSLDAAGWYSLERLKPLAVEKTTIVTDPNTGDYVGLKNCGVDLPAVNTLVFTNDGEDGNLYGRSRHENIREYAWAPWVSTVGQGGKYVSKNASVIPMVEYPDGESRDKTGRVVSNFEIATSVLANLQRGNGVAMPNVLAKWAENLIGQGVDVKQLAAWKISFLENNGASMLGGLVQLMAHYESLMLRGWIVPESAVTIGKYGTKGQSESSIDLALDMAQETLTSIVTHGNRYIVNDLLALNYGPNAVDTVKIATTPLDDSKSTFARDLIGKVLTDPTNLSLLLEMVDVQAVIDQQGLPKPKAGEMPVITTPDPIAADPSTQVATPAVAGATGSPSVGAGEVARKAGSSTESRK